MTPSPNSSGRRHDNRVKTPGFNLGYRIIRSVASERRFMILTFIILFFTIPALQARKVKTRHSIPKYTEKTIGTVTPDSILSIESDSLTFVDKIRPAIRFYGFDKTVTSAMESFFIINGLNDEIRGMEIQITYFDMQGRQLHKRTVNIECDIPAGETKRVDTKSWDTQKSFYFHQSVKPKRQATPFSVKLDLLSLTLDS